MKMRTIGLLLCLSSLAATHAQEAIVNQVPPGRNLRAGIVHDNEATPSKGSMTGLEITYAQNMYPFDQMGLKYAHMSSSSVEHNSFLLFFEDRYALTETLSVYGTSGIGYMLTDLSNAQNKDGWMGVLGLGLLLDLEGPWMLYASAEYALSTERLWVDGDSLAKRNLQFTLGVRWAF